MAQERIEVGDGSFEAFLALPGGGEGPGILKPEASPKGWPHTLRFLARALDG